MWLFDYCRFGSGYTLTLRASTEETKKSGSSNSINNEAIAKLKDLVSRTFPLAELKEEHYNQVVLNINGHLSSIYLINYLLCSCNTSYP